jgi:hypothetical protein
MEIIEDEPDDIDPANALSPKQRDILIHIARMEKNDTFYDLGSGYGYVVFDVVKKTGVKSAIGIEVDYKRFCRSVRLARRKLTKRELKRAELYCTNYLSYDLSDATVIYEGHERTEGEVEEFEKRISNNGVRIITIDLPFIGYRPIRAIVCEARKFFVMQTPFRKYRTSNPDKWAAYTLSRKKATLQDVYDYYDDMLKEEGHPKKDRRQIIRKLRSIVKASFQKRSKNKFS